MPADIDGAQQGNVSWRIDLVVAVIRRRAAQAVTVARQSRVRIYPSSGTRTECRARLCPVQPCLMQPANLRLLTTGSHRPVPTAEPPPDNGSAHIVHFYENDAELTETVADFLAEGLVSSQPLIVIATAARRQSLLARLRSKGFDLEYLRRAGRFVLLDARETLTQILDGGSPDPRKFNSHVGAVVERTRRDSGHATVRAFGEMVDLLWQEGNTAGAIRLEELWNELGARCALSLLCAYAAGPSYVMADEDAVEEVRRQHTHVIRDGEDPEQELEPGEWLPAYRVLEQRAQALEREIEQRKELER